MAVSSEFYRDLSKVEKKIFKISLRKAKAYALLSLAVVPLTIEFIFLPDFIFYLVFSLQALYLEPIQRYSC